MKDDQKEFFEDLATHFDNWVKTIKCALCEENTDLIWSECPESYQKLQKTIKENEFQEDIEKILKETFKGVIHSVLVTFDGGTALAEKTQLKIKSSNGEIFDRFLHELFSEYMLETGRVK